MAISKIAVVGAGFMGTGIAEAAASVGVEVIVCQPGQSQIERSRGRLVESVDRAVAKEKLTRDAADALLGRISYSTSIDALAGADAVIEAVTEDATIKRKVFQTLDTLLPEATFLASNTSSIPIAELAAGTARPERVVGLHFFSPVPVMKLVELVPGLDSSPSTVAAARAFAEQLGKEPILTRDRAGFVVNLLLIPYLISAVRLYEEGLASRDDIDTGMRLGCGHPMGPLTLCDFIGLDVIQAICDSLYEEFKQPQYAAPPLLRRMVVSGHHGRKTGRGFYDYT